MKTEQGDAAPGRLEEATASDTSDKKRVNEKREPNRPGALRRKAERYAAIDLGTNNCRLLIAAPKGRELRIVDAYSQIVRLGAGLGATGRLSDEAMARAVKALKVCSEKIARREVTHMRCIATQACRGAANGETFLTMVKEETGLVFDIISPEEEARLAVQGCVDLLDEQSPGGLVFDIGGGSTELSWVRQSASDARADIAACASLPFGVVSLAEEWGGRDLADGVYGKIVAFVREKVAALGDPAAMRETFDNERVHYLGTSGTITSIAGVHLGLRQYRRDRVDGLWLDAEQIRAVADKLKRMSFDERAKEPCIGFERADLVVCGCAILEALLQEWPVRRVRVADRGLREGVLTDLARQAKRDRRRRRRSRLSRGPKKPVIR